MDRLQRRAPAAFHIAGALTLAGAGLLVLGLTGAVSDDGMLWPLFMLTAALSGLTCAVGLLGLQPPLRDRVPVLARAGVGISAIAAVGALLLLVTVLVGAVVVVWLGRDIGAIEPIFAIGSFAMLGGLLVGLPLVGAAVWRAAAAPPVVGPLLVVGGLLFLLPLADVLLGWRPPEWLPAVAFGLWAAVFLTVGTALRTDRTGSPPRSPDPALHG